MAEDTLLEFPTDFPLKIMGAATDDFRSLVSGIVTRHFGELEPSRIEERPSSGNINFGTARVNAADQALGQVQNLITRVRDS